MGLNGSGELKNHIWFREFDWRALLHRKIKPPFIPSSGDNFDQQQISNGLRDYQKELNQKSFSIFNTIKDSDSFQDQFENFFFDRDK